MDFWKVLELLSLDMSQSHDQVSKVLTHSLNHAVLIFNCRSIYASLRHLLELQKMLL